MHENKSSNKSSRVIWLATLGSATVLLIWALVGIGSSRNTDNPQNVPSVPQYAQAMLPSPQPTSPAGSTTPVEIPLPPTAVVHTTPTIVELSTATLITPSLVSSMTLDTEMDAGLQVNNVANSAAPIVSLAWAPTGDKVLYVTKAGNLYWANPDGSSATLLHTYEPDTIFSLLHDQRPMTNTLLLRHVGPPQGMTRAPGHLDVIRFTPGQPPTLEEVPDAGAVYGLHWWSADRASGTLYTGNEGSEKFITVDANGLIVEERIIPYIQSAAVQPGGEWLAYSTAPGSPNRPFYGSEPSTAYLLNLQTNQRLQISPSGKGYVRNWSPDGNWLLMSAEINGKGRTMLSSPDGLERVIVPSLGYDPVWTPDSQSIWSYSAGVALDHDAQTPVPASSELQIVDVVGNKVGTADGSILPQSSSGLMMKPAWSPDGSQLALLSYDPGCEATALCSGLEPAFYVMSTK